MNNLLNINGYQAAITYDPELNLLRGEVIELNGGADFYAANLDSLKQEAAISLQTYLDVCQEQGIEPRKQYSGKFNVRVSPEIHKATAIAAKAQHMSLNEWISKAIMQAAN